MNASTPGAPASAPGSSTPPTQPTPATPPAPIRLSLSRDAFALALGAEGVADALHRQAAAAGVALVLQRTGSHGMAWLEPLLELHTPQGRLAFGPVAAEDVPSLWPALTAGAAGAHSAGPAHPLALGPTDRIPYLARQQRLSFDRCGLVDPLSLADHEAHRGWGGLRTALAMAPADIVAAVTESGLRGRGGAAFPAGIKWATVAAAAAPRKHVVCNADEGDSGTFADRMLIEGDPFRLIEGMVIAGLAVSATEGVVYLRAEYPQAIATMRAAIDRAAGAGWLGDDIHGSGRAFRLRVFEAAGAYICGEETALLESLEGRRGQVRAKPPLPAMQGLFGEPTLVHNVLTLAAVPTIVAQGAAAYRAHGIGRSTGTMPFQLAGNIRHGGLVETGFGVTLRELVFGFGGGTRSGRPVKAIQVGGPLGAYVPEPLWGLPMEHDTWAGHGLVLGHGGIVVHDDSADMAALARHAMAFCAHESCGKCTPCRIGAVRGVETIDRLRAAPPERRAAQAALLRELCETMTLGSLCAMGGMTPYPVLSALDLHPQDFGLPAGSHQGSLA